MPCSARNARSSNISPKASQAWRAVSGVQRSELSWSPTPSSHLVRISESLKRGGAARAAPPEFRARATSDGEYT
jgi:hypothetical protein